MMLGVYLFFPILVIGTVLVAGAIRRTTVEARRLGESVEGLNLLRPALVEVQTEAERARRAFQELRNR